MKKLALVALTAGAVISMAGAALAQGFYFGFGTDPYYGPAPYYGPPSYGPRPYYRDYDEPRYYRYGESGYSQPGRYRTWNGCQRGWTVQDGVCKPYRGY
jgi:hypothetical protein